MERKRKVFFQLVLLIKRTKIWVTWKYSVASFKDKITYLNLFLNNG